jgi:hypothetical protein
MVPLQHFATGVLAEVIRRQPPSPERTVFAWQVSVGAALARATAVDLADGVLTVRVRDARYAPESRRAVSTILPRLRHLLGPSDVSRIDVV